MLHKNQLVSLSLLELSQVRGGAMKNFNPTIKGIGFTVSNPKNFTTKPNPTTSKTDHPGGDE